MQGGIHTSRATSRDTSPDIDLSAAIKRHHRERRKTGFGLAVLACVLWVVYYGMAWAVAWFVAWVATDGGRTESWMLHAGAAAAMGLLALATLVYLWRGDAEPNVPEQFTAMDQILSRHEQVTGQLAGAYMLMVPRTTAEAIRHIRRSAALSADERSTAQKIVNDLCNRNDWIPADRYAAHAVVVAKLIKLEVVWLKRFTMGMYVRLNPSLMP